MGVIVQLLGIFSGVLIRTLLPFFRKLYQGKITSFKKKYLFQALGAFLISIVFSLLIFPQYRLKIEENVDWLATFKLFCVSFTFGFGFNSLVNELGEWKKK
ncbi:MAG: hypothetical protein J7K17_02585 [Candidatus Omnitrophica bacterium]|nr:hypothetical protein [Candidatus Omnitrophota bacterium]